MCWQGGLRIIQSNRDAVFGKASVSTISRHTHMHAHNLYSTISQQGIKDEIPFTTAVKSQRRIILHKQNLIVIDDFRCNWSVFFLIG